MDPKALLNRLELAEQHVLTGEAAIDAQVATVAAMTRGGQDTGLAESLLQTFRELQSTFVADRDRLLALWAAG